MSENRSRKAILSECPDCGGRLQRQTRIDVLCLECETVFAHEVRTGGRHYLWRDGELAATSRMTEIEIDGEETEVRGYQ